MRLGSRLVLLGVCCGLNMRSGSSRTFVISYVAPGKILGSVLIRKHRESYFREDSSIRGASIS